MLSLCPHCKHKFEVPAVYKGKQIKCLKCKKEYKFTAPDEKCENCFRIIGNLEKVFVYKNHVLCGVCNTQLRDADKKTENLTLKQGDIITNTSPRCHLCGSDMEPEIIGSGNALGIALGLITLIVGVYVTFTFLLCGGPIIGIILLVCAFCMMIGKKQKVLKCLSCGTITNRA